MKGGLKERDHIDFWGEAFQTEGITYLQAEGMRGSWPVEDSMETKRPEQRKQEGQ